MNARPHEEAGAKPAVLILCGGKSTRMGTPKAFLEVDGVLLIERVIAVAREISSNILLVTPSPQEYRRFGLQLVTDEEPGRGPLAGLAAGLRSCRTPAAWALACDLPDLSAGPLLAMQDLLAPEIDAVVPRSGRGLEPLCALYRRECGEVFTKALVSGISALHEAFAGIRVAHPTEKEIGAPAGFFANLNTPKDLKGRGR